MFDARHVSFWHLLFFFFLNIKWGFAECPVYVHRNLPRSLQPPPKMITGSTEQTGHFCPMFCTRNIVRYYFRLYILKWRFNINNLVLNVINCVLLWLFQAQLKELKIQNFVNSVKLIKKLSGDALSAISSSCPTES
jgi:hypothetical protein